MCDNSVVHIPFTLLPSPFPAKLYRKCLSVQPALNDLMCKVANDFNFMEEILRPIAKVDNFTKGLLDVNYTVEKEGRAQSVMSCISRADYMLDQFDNTSLRVRQVEVNAIASGMSAHSCKLKGLHEYLSTKYNLDLPDGATLPENNSMDLVVQGIIDAFDAYGKKDVFVLLINEERSLNFSEHQQLELNIAGRRPDIKVLRRRFIDLDSLVQLGPNRELLLEESREVAVVYFRYGYDPSNYNGTNAWHVRLLLERSRAIKCPSINFHLSGVKKFQQALNSQKHLERFLDEDSAKQLADTFCQIWSLDSETNEISKMIRDDSSKLVLKPQREGGGHNIFGDQIKEFVDNINNPDERSQYILMEYINSPKEYNWLLLKDDMDNRLGLTSPHKLISELGVYGSILSDGPNILFNRVAGYLVRSKKFGVNEGGVASGFAGIGNIFLVEDDELTEKFSLYYDESN